MSGSEKGVAMVRGQCCRSRTVCHDVDGARSNFALRERAERGGPGRAPRDRVDDEGRTVNDMKSILCHQGVEGTRRRCRNERTLGRRVYGGEGTGEGTEVNRNKSEISWK
jgi:hypothetical protein